MEDSTYTPGMGSGGSSNSGGTGTPVMEQAKQQAQDMMQQAKEGTGQLVDQAREQIRTRVTTGKDQLTSNLESVSVALRETGDSLRSQDQGQFAGVLDTAAGAVENVSTFFRDNEVEDLVRQGEDFARRQPAVFLGIAFGLGFLAARFLKSGGQSNGGYYAGASRYSGADTTAVSPYTGSSVGDSTFSSSALRSDITGSSDFDDVDELADAESARTTLP